jgi:hypothetical protein
MDHWSPLKAIMAKLVLVMAQAAITAAFFFFATTGAPRQPRMGRVKDFP